MSCENINSPQFEHSLPAVDDKAFAGQSKIFVYVDGVKFQYLLTAEDLAKVFSKYGSLSTVKVTGAGDGAYIYFNKSDDALKSVQDLDGKVLNGVQGQLKVTLCSDVPIPTEAEAPPKQPLTADDPYFMNTWNSSTDAAFAVPPIDPYYHPMNLPYGTIYPQYHPFPHPASNGSGMYHYDPSYSRRLSAYDYVNTDALPPPVTTDPLMAGGHSNSINGDVGPRNFGDGRIGTYAQKKYMARFEIGIENDKSFQVARRIIGYRGANMKNILLVVPDAKLRLRGIGSGFYEGQTHSESPDPLHLCLSCKDYSNYQIAIERVTVLLEQVYSDYYQYQTEIRPDATPALIQVHFTEHVMNDHFNRNPVHGSQGAGYSHFDSLYTGNRSTSLKSIPDEEKAKAPPVTDNSPASSVNRRHDRRVRTSTRDSENTSLYPHRNLRRPHNVTQCPRDNETVAVVPRGPQYMGMIKPRGMLHEPPFDKARSTMVRNNLADCEFLSKSGPYYTECEPPNISTPDLPSPNEIERLIDERNRARRVCNFDEADRIRSYLKSHGVALMDEPGGRGTGSEVTTWRYWRR